MLSRVPLFLGLEREEFEALSQATALQYIAKGEVIVWAGEEGNVMFLIRRGKVKVSRSDEGGREVILGFLRRGDYFGEMALLDSRPRSATVTALEDTELLILKRESLLALIQAKPEIALTMMRVLTWRLRLADRRIGDFAFLKVAGRVAAVLLYLAEIEGKPAVEGILLSDPPTRRDIAAMSGTQREAVSRLLKEFETKGWIARRGKAILILKHKGLEDYLHRYSPSEVGGL